MLEALRDAQVLIPAQLRHRAPPTPIDPADVPLATLVLEVAQTCNLRCSYCYAGGGSYGGAPRLMRPELARRAARHLVESSGEREQVTLVLFGGEPLLNFPAIEAAVSEAEAAASAAGKKLVVSLTTNGTRFTPEALDFLSEHRVGDLREHRRPARRARRESPLPGPKRRRHLRRRRRRDWSCCARTAAGRPRRA